MKLERVEVLENGKKIDEGWLELDERTINPMPWDMFVVTSKDKEYFIAMENLKKLGVYAEITEDGIRRIWNGNEEYQDIQSVQHRPL